MLVTTEEQFYDALTRFTPEMVVDIESTGFDLWNTDEICGIGVCTVDEHTYYFPFRHTTKQEFTLLSLMEAEDSNGINLPLNLITPLLDAIQRCTTIVGSNIKFDLAGLRRDGYRVPYEQIIEDTVTMARMYFKNKYDRLGLDASVNALFPHEDFTDWKKDFKKYMQKLKIKKYSEASPETIGAYCEKDCLWTMRIRNEFREHIEHTEQTFVWEQERELCPVLWRMEEEGLYFDHDYMVTKIPQLKLKLAELQAEIYGEIGMEFDILSGDQLTKALNSIGIKADTKTNAGNDQWDTSQLLAIDSPVGPKILEFRSIDKMRSTYFEPLYKWVDGRQHPNFKSAGTISGRMSCSEPNLQNLANKSIQVSGDKYDDEAVDAIKALMGARGRGAMDAGKSKGSIKTAGTFSNLISSTSKFEDTAESISVKRLYIPPPGFTLWFFDFNQMEMRVFSDYVRDESMFEVLEDPKFDFHAYAAREVWKVDETNPLWKFYRTLAKAINFGLIYGIGTDKLARQLQKTVEEAQQYKDDYFTRFPKARRFMRSVSNMVKERGWIKNRFGRRYWIDAERAYVGVNYLVQGTSADIVKSRMIACDKILRLESIYRSQKLQEYEDRIRELKRSILLSKQVVQVHDELIFYVHDSEEHFLPKLLKDTIEERQIKTFLPVEASKGFPSWAHKKDMCVECLTVKEKDHTCQRTETVLSAPRK